MLFFGPHYPFILLAMKPWTLRAAWALLVLSAVGLGVAAAPAAPAAPSVLTVYLVRHAEKELAPGLADPPLTAAGQARAQALAGALRRAHPAALFTTNTQRTRATLAPLAAATGLAPQVYRAQQPGALADTLRRAYAGRTAVVVHSNTLLPLLAALGGPRAGRRNSGRRVQLFVRGAGAGPGPRHGARTALRCALSAAVLANKLQKPPHETRFTVGNHPCAGGPKWVQRPRQTAGNGW
jgi:phosphohistidine phosphatase SixA